MATYKKHCMYCNQLVPGNASICPLCGRDDPFDLRCPKCRNIVEKRWKVCSNCGFSLNITCPACGKEVFAAARCNECGARLVVTCTRRGCGETQVISQNQKCVKCGKPLKLK